MNKSAIEEQAKNILLEHGLFTVPVNPVVLANKLGIKVFNAKFSDESLAAMVARRGDDITILLEESDPPYRKRFSIAHELGHHFLHLVSDGEIVDKSIDLFRDSAPAGETIDEERRKEIEANQFAAALLMPAELVREKWSSTESMGEMAKLFNVSEAAMGFRLTSLGLG